MRCKEFFMKDAYSFDLSDEEAKKSYNKMFFSYLNTFKRLSLTAIPMAADTGPIGGDLSHEFIILAETGESKIYSDKRIFDIDINKHNSDDNSINDLRKKYDAFYAVTDDKFKKEDFEHKVKKENQLITKGIEVGHIFYFGDKYSKPLKCSVDLKDGKKVNVKMGSYGVGVSRLVGAIIEAKFNNNVMRWPESVSPFDVVIIPSLQKNDKSNYEKAEKIYNFLIKNKIDVLFDDTDDHLSAKFKKFDLIGIPYQIILGSKSNNEKFEFKEICGKTNSLSLDEIKNRLLNRRNLH
jgi:prolyl-tRNA synthetase